MHLTPDRNVELGFIVVVRRERDVAREGSDRPRFQTHGELIGRTGSQR